MNYTRKELNEMWNLGFDLGSKMSVAERFREAKFLVTLSTKECKESAIRLFDRYKMTAPDKFFTIEETPVLKDAFIAGIIGDKRKD